MLPDFHELSQFNREGISLGKQLESESDRGAALVGLAFLDELLKRLFEAKMHVGKITKKLLEYPGALSTASARSDVAISLGWIGAKTYRDLVTLRQIRNKFAHAHEPMKFADAPIQKLCAKLNLREGKMKGLFHTTERRQFMWAAASVAFRLEFYRQTAKRPLSVPGGPPEE
jgi:DNA-binding MltR family transcriptional regulator